MLAAVLAMPGIILVAAAHGAASEVGYVLIALALAPVFVAAALMLPRPRHVVGRPPQAVRVTREASGVRELQRITLTGDLSGEYTVEQELPDGRLMIRPAGPGKPAEAVLAEQAAIEDDLVAHERERAENEVERIRASPQQPEPPLSE
jgi:hypothetical protein